MSIEISKLPSQQLIDKATSYDADKDGFLNRE